MTNDFKHSSTYNAIDYLEMCCHIIHNNEIFIIFTHDFIKEQYVLPEDDTQYAIETYRRILRALV